MNAEWLFKKKNPIVEVSHFAWDFNAGIASIWYTFTGQFDKLIAYNIAVDKLKRKIEKDIELYGYWIEFVLSMAGTLLTLLICRYIGGMFEGMGMYTLPVSR
jgi:hypothetical protein